MTILRDMLMLDSSTRGRIIPMAHDGYASGSTTDTFPSIFEFLQFLYFLDFKLTIFSKQQNPSIFFSFFFAKKCAAAVERECRDGRKKEMRTSAPVRVACVTAMIQL